MKRTGLDKIMRNLNKEIRKIEGKTQQGLTAAALLVKARALPKTPIDTGNLRASCYVASGTGSFASRALSGALSGALKKEMTRQGYSYTGGEAPQLVEATGVKKDQPWAVIGYTASYAIYVHEIDKAYRAPGTSWKFLEQAVIESEKDILKIIKRTARI